VVIGLLTGELHFPENHSLKGKRVVLRKILERLKQRLNVSVAEVDYQNLWQRSLIAIACVNTSTREANTTLTHALNMIDAFYEAELLEHHIEIR